MSRRADELAAEYLMRQVPEEPLLIQDGSEHVSPLRFVAGVLVLGLVAFVCFWGL